MRLRVLKVEKNDSSEQSQLLKAELVETEEKCRAAEKTILDLQASIKKKDSELLERTKVLEETQQKVSKLIEDRTTEATAERNSL